MAVSQTIELGKEFRVRPAKPLPAFFDGCDPSHGSEHSIVVRNTSLTGTISWQVPDGVRADIGDNDGVRLGYFPYGRTAVVVYAGPEGYAIDPQTLPIHPAFHLEGDVRDLAGIKAYMKVNGVLFIGKGSSIDTVGHAPGTGDVIIQDFSSKRQRVPERVFIPQLPRVLAASVLFKLTKPLG